jgi:hypothetical protein
MLSSLLTSMTLLETEDDMLFSELTVFWQGMLCDLVHQHYHQHAWLFFNRNMAKVALLLPILPNHLLPWNTAGLIRRVRPIGILAVPTEMQRSSDLCFRWASACANKLCACCKDTRA